jgi:hypothetical protein
MRQSVRIKRKNEEAVQDSSVVCPTKVHRLQSLSPSPRAVAGTSRAVVGSALDAAPDIDPSALVLSPVAVPPTTHPVTPLGLSPLADVAREIAIDTLPQATPQFANT